LVIAYLLLLLLQLSTRTTADCAEGFFNTRMDKQINTYLFDIDGSLRDSSSLGIFSINQDYNGNGLIVDGVSFRDEEELILEYTYPMKSGFAVGSYSYANYVSDQRSNTLSELQRFGSLITLGYSLVDETNQEVFSLKNFSSKLAYGLEQNKRLQLNSGAQRSRLDLTIAAQDFNTFLNFNSTNDHLLLNLGRENFESKSSLDILEVFDFGDKLSGNFFYNVLDRDLLGVLTEGLSIINPDYTYSIENRTEERFGGKVGLDIKITEWLSSSFQSDLSQALIVRDYKYPIEGLDLSNISRVLNENLFNFTTSYNLVLGQFISDGGIQLSNRTETNRASLEYELSQSKLENLQTLESLRDNSQNRTRVFSKNAYKLENGDIFQTDFSISILQYDTPSGQNNDDRDELTYQIEAGYSHRFSNTLDYNLNLNYFANHFVYLKSQYSAQNRWNRILTLNQSIRLQNEIVEFNPTISLIANYTSFDYEALSQSVNSFSLRQINYSDSLQLKISKSLYTESNLLVRYYERGLLFWDDFAETPESANFERSAKLLLIAENIAGSRYGIGGRIYKLEQERIGPGVRNNFGDFEQFSYGPEILVELRFDSGNYFRLSGWYEYQTTQGQGFQEVPNIFITSNIVF